MRLRLLLAGLALLLALPPGGAAAQDDCCLLLLVPVGARSSALAGAITARPGTDAMFRNPAGLAGLGRGSFVVHHADRSLVDVNAFSVILTPRIGTLGVSYQLFDYGRSEMTDETGQRIGELTIRDHLLVASVGRPLGGGLSVGASYKGFQERVDCRGLCAGQERVVTTQAMDAGLRFTPGWHPALEIGLAAVNIPLSSRTTEGATAFPARLHVGASYDLLSWVLEDEPIALRVAVDVQDELRRLGRPVPSAGLELDVHRAIFLRAGYTLGEGLASGAAVGIELRYDRFDIGVSRSFVNTVIEEDEPFQITFGINF